VILAGHDNQELELTDCYQPTLDISINGSFSTLVQNGHPIQLKIIYNSMLVQSDVKFT
jgi:hypothetical protein